MRRFFSFTVVLAAFAAHGEIVDRIALTVGREIITEEQILLSMRVAAFLNGEPLRVTPATKRAAAQKLLELTLISVETTTSRYPEPLPKQIDDALAAVKKQLFGSSEDKYRAALASYGISEADVRRSLAKQLATLSFIDFRFRPAVQIQEDEIVEFYREEYTTEFKKANPGKEPPRYLEVRNALAETLTQQRVDNLLDRWISQTESQSRIQWVERVFAEVKTP
jgi:hypothetical protein